MVDVVDEAVHAASQDSQSAQRGGMVYGPQPVGPHGVHVAEGIHVGAVQAPFDDNRPEGVVQNPAGIMRKMPVDGGSGDGVAGGASDALGGVIGISKGQFDARAVEEIAASLLVMFDGADGGFSLIKAILRINGMQF